METSVITMILRNGMPTGIVQCNLDEWIGVSYKIPRNRLNESKELKNIENTGVYILFGVDEETGENRAYIGEAENIYKRLLQHNKTKDFWNDCLVFVSQNNSLNKAHIKFIENMLYTKAKEVERFIIDNDTEPTKSSLDGADEIRAVKFYEKIVLLTSVYGYRIFDKILTQQEVKEEEIYYINSIGLKASGAQSEEGFIVFKGSQSSEEFKKASSQSLRNKWNELRNQKIVDQGVFLKDIIFSSPSTAAAMVLGRNSNGLTQWKNRDGKTLKENMNKE
ncbi:putative uncharacterized protein [Clostridium sp. CAG:440]|jgi:hypothetical protein|nr:putative uncharacterized protein [Clostridium sp. CAG:575]CDE24863.1 putative uncharacterized protein [Clostridium sp. CAG:440]